MLHGYMADAVVPGSLFAGTDHDMWNGMICTLSLLLQFPWDTPLDLFHTLS